MPVLQRIKPRLLEHWLLAWLKPEEKWVIAYRLRFSKTPLRYLKYHPTEVWVWTTNQHKATVFKTEQAAEVAALKCTVSWKYDYEVYKLS